MSSRVLDLALVVAAILGVWLGLVAFGMLKGG